MLTPIALCIKNSLIPESLHQENCSLQISYKCAFYHAAALTIWLAFSSRQISPLCFLCADSGGSDIKPSSTLLSLVVVRLHYDLLVAQPYKGW